MGACEMKASRSRGSSFLSLNHHSRPQPLSTRNRSKSDSRRIDKRKDRIGIESSKVSASDTFVESGSLSQPELGSNREAGGGKREEMLISCCSSDALLFYL